MFSINYFAKKVTQNRRKSQLFHFISFVISRLRVRSSQKHQSLSRVMTEKWRYRIHCHWKVSSQHSNWLRYKRPTSTIGLCKWVHMMNRRLSIKKIYMKLYLWESTITSSQLIGNEFGWYVSYQYKKYKFYCAHLQVWLANFLATSLIYKALAFDLATRYITVGQMLKTYYCSVSTQPLSPLLL